MKDLVAAIATLVFVAATFGAMLHAGILVTCGGSFAWLCAWFVPVAIASIAMAITDAPTPVWEIKRG